MDIKMEWIKHFPHAVTVADPDGKVTFMNDKAIQTFADHGGAALIGSSLYDCHKPSSVEKIKHMLATGESNIYTIEKAGVKKMIVQQPLLDNGRVTGIVEISIILPAEVAHFVRS